MIRLWCHSLVPLWAAREVLRRPGEGVLIGITLFLLALTTATPLVLYQTYSTTANRALEQSPAVVVRRTGPGGWAPLPIEDAVSAAHSVAGVTGAAPRTWGTVAGPDGPLTVVGFNHQSWKRLKGVLPGSLPAPGRCIIGPGVSSEESHRLRLRNGQQEVTVDPVARLDPDTAIVSQGLVVLNEVDARRLLQIPPGFAADLAVDVFHEGEQAAILAELAAAFPWPVRVTTRSEVRRAYAAGLSRDGTLWLLALIPAVLAMILVVLSTGRAHSGTQREVALLKALGWTTSDIVTLHALKGLYVAVPAVATGLLGACFFVFWPAIRWPDRLLYGGAGPTAALYLDPSGVGLTLLLVAVLTLCPYLAAIIWPSARGATRDPLAALRQGQIRIGGAE